MAASRLALRTKNEPYSYQGLLMFESMFRLVRLTPFGEFLQAGIRRVGSHCGISELMTAKWLYGCQE